MTASRSAELRLATWGEIDLAGMVWTVPGERMKAKREHRVPLCGRAVEILGEAKQLRGLRNPAAKGDLVFRSMRGKALHGTMISTLVRELRIAAVPHVVPIVVPGTGLRNGRTTRGRSSRRRWRTW